ncbi:MAG: response regulator [Verrucomicrobiota bacterium]
MSRKKTQERKPQGKVLVVDDEPLAFQAVVHMLARASVGIVTAVSPAEALSLWSKERDQIEYAVLDIVLPGMSGTSIAKRLKADKQSVRIVFISGFQQKQFGIARPSHSRGCKFSAKAVWRRRTSGAPVRLFIFSWSVGR